MKIKIGDVFGKLTVVNFARNGYRKYAICNCSCGKESFPVRLDSLTKSETSSRKPAKSCGCLQREAVTKHGVWKHPLYRVWDHMMKRCYDPKDKRYYCYGDRGIKVCPKWHNVKSFIADMEATYKPGLQINRIDNDQGYSKENCEWTDRIGQALNKSDTVKITFNGETRSMRQWAKHLGITYGTLVERIRVLNWPIELAFTKPVRKGNYHWQKS